MYAFGTDCLDEHGLIVVAGKSVWGSDWWGYPLPAEGRNVRHALGQARALGL